MAFPIATAQAGDSAFDIGLAAGATVTDSLEVLGNSPSFSLRAGYWFNPTIAAEVDFGYAMGQTQIGTPEYYPFTSMTPRLNMVGKVWPDEKINLLFVAGVGLWLKNIDDNGDLRLPQGTDTDIDFVGNAGPGINVPLTDDFSVRTDLRWMLSLGGENWENRGDAFMNWEWTGGVMLLIGGPKDEDKDGIVDDEDSCPAIAEDIDGFEDADGCPELDNDEDGIADADDHAEDGTSCANAAEDIDNFEDEDGCPDLDNDEDGVPDTEDACPYDTGMESAKGCPDADGDGLADSLDECERDAGDEATFGCPDGDGDLIPDYRDVCPEVAGPEGASVFRSNGCLSDVFPTEDGLVVSVPIAWSGTRGKWRATSNLMVDNVFQVANGVKSLTKLEVQVYSEGEAGDEKALAIAQARADAILAYMVAKEIDEGRVTAKGVERDLGEGEEVAEDAPNVFVAALDKTDITMLKKKYEDAVDDEGGEEEAPEEEAPSDEDGE
jgi:hypothetical protein